MYFDENIWRTLTGSCEIFAGDTGEPGESGGNVALTFKHCSHLDYFTILNHGGRGGPGQEGGDGSEGVKGQDAKAKWTEEDLNTLLPSTATKRSDKHKTNLNVVNDFIDKFVTKKLEKKNVGSPDDFFVEGKTVHGESVTIMSNEVDHRLGKYKYFFVHIAGR